MPKYLIDRNFSKITEDELGEFAKNSKRLAIERFHDVVWHHSHVVIDPDGVVHTFCVYSRSGRVADPRARGRHSAVTDRLASP